ncbi:MAG: hypothetical protein ABW096_12695 [Candidatus Thiodiazotropha sp.]
MELNSMMRAHLSAVLVVLSITVSLTAEAVNLSHDATGQVLLYPYYNVNQGNVTFISVTNTTAVAKAVKVRFREAVGGESVFDFTLYLSPRDVWVGALLQQGGAVRLAVPEDTSCTIPDTATLTATDFSTARFDSAYVPVYDGILYADDLPARLSEGHIEIIELAELPYTNGARDISDAITHNQTTTPVAPMDCAVAASFNNSADIGAILDAGNVTTSGVTQAFQSPGGGLMGNAAIFNASSGIYFPYNATALRAFATNPIWWPQNSEAFTHVEGVATVGEDSAGNAISNYRTADNGSTVPSAGGTLNRDLPDLSTPSMAEVSADSSAYMAFSHDAASGEQVINSGSFGGSVPDAKRDKALAVSAALAGREIRGEYITSGDYGTEWVVTFPTKYLHVPDYVTGVENTSTSPFVAYETVENGQACHNMWFEHWNREEDEYEPVINNWFPIPNLDLCHNVNIIALNDGSNQYTNVLSSKAVKLGLLLDFSDGWASIGLEAYVSELTVSGAGDPSTVIGLPVIGFVAVADMVSGIERGGLFPLHITADEQ